MAELLKPDLCVVGAGAGGLSVAAAAASFGAQVVLVKRGRMGGTDLNFGSIHSKSLIAAARRSHVMAQAHHFGLNLDGGMLDFERVRQYVHRVASTIALNDTKERYVGLGVRVIEGSAKFIDPRTIAVGEAIRIRARRFVIATGSSPALPPIEGLDKTSHLTNETIFDLDQCPEHLVVIGAGAVGLELAQAFRRLGAEVTVLDAGEPLAREDPECAQIVVDALAREGIAFRVGISVAGVGEVQAGAMPASEQQSVAAQVGEGQPRGMQAADVATIAARPGDTQAASGQADSRARDENQVADDQPSALPSHRETQSPESEPSEVPAVEAQAAGVQAREPRVDELRPAVVQAGKAPATEAELIEAQSGETRGNETQLAPVQVGEREPEAPLLEAQASGSQTPEAQPAQVQMGEAQSSAALLTGAQAEMHVAAVQVTDALANETGSEPLQSDGPRFESLPNGPQLDELQRHGDQPSAGRSWLQIVVTGPNGEETIAASHILVATARRPNLDGLGLEAGRIKYGQRGIIVDKRLRTSNGRVFAIGDVTGQSPFTHAATHHAGLVVRNALFGVPGRVHEEEIPRVVFTDPEFAQAGLTEEQARSRGYAICILRWPYHENDRAQAEDTVAGHIKVVTTKKGRILGATIVGASAGELITTWTLAISQKLNVRTFAGIMVPYPTLAEVGMRAAATYFIPRLTSLWVRRIMALLRLLR